MKNRLLFLCMLCAITGAAQQPYWQQKVDVTLNVTLHDSDRALDGFEKISYTNNAPDTLQYIWFHLWPNAYKNDRTAFSEQLLQQDKTDFYFSSKEEKGYINRLDFKIDGNTTTWEDHPEHIDIIKLLLPAPLPPGGHITITTPFHVKLPYAFSRGGYSNGAFQVTQWYPKPAVYDAQGWHTMPYLEQGEYYNDFGDYDVTITLPQDYVVAATGALQNEAERKWLQSGNTRPTDAQENEGAQPHEHLKKLPASANKKNANSNFFKTPYPTKTLQFQQTNVTDFAWMADKNFKVDFDTCQLPSGRIIEVYTYYLSRPSTPWKSSVAFTKAALRFYSKSVGEYPYTSVHVAESTATPGGMEYPGFTIIGPVFTEKDLDIVIAHEVGHNWFQGCLATNERAAPWLDEGVNSFYEKKYSAERYGNDVAWESLAFQSLVKEKRDQPITTPAADFTEMNYTLVAYTKTAQWLALVEQQAGAEVFQKAMQAYYRQWQFKHPQETDFKNALSTALPDTSAFALLNQKGPLPNQQLSGFKIVSPLWPNSIRNFSHHPPRRMLLLSPALGYNNYDKLMLGGVITNYGLPLTNLRFVAVPLYATGSKNWNGIGNLAYRIFSDKQFRKIEAGITGMAFSKSYMPDSNDHTHYERFYKVAPYLRFTWNEPLQSTRDRALEWRTFFITEKNFSSFVTKIDGHIYVDSLKTQSYYINQLSWNVTDYRALYPYSYQVQLQQGRSFYRINLTGNYFFNYAKGGGASVRLFAAKFGYLTNKVASRLGTTRFQPKLLGVTGEEDYTYSSYFLGRTASYANDASVLKNSGLAAQQVMLRDGAFKLRLDQFEFLQGRSENWVVALNLATTLPHQIIPKFLPLKLFLDVGTYAEAGKENAPTNRILYVGGLQLPLLKGIINIYAPLVYSSDFRENLKTLPEQNTFFKRLTFSIDLSQLSMQRLTRNKLSL